MLDFAHHHQTSLKEEFYSVQKTSRYFWYNSGTFLDFDLAFATDTWGQLQCVSIGPRGKLLGFLSCEINRTSRRGHNLRAIRFAEDPTPAFGRDLMAFVVFLLTHVDLRKIRWSAIGHNAAINLYNRVARTVPGGRRVGTFFKDVMLADGAVYDRHLYEINRPSSNPGVYWWKLAGQLRDRFPTHALTHHGSHS